MDAVLQMPDKARATVMDDVRAIIANLEKVVAVQASNFQHVLESQNRTEMVVNNQMAKAEAARERIYGELQQLDKRLAKVENSQDVVMSQSAANANALKTMSEQTLTEWIRKNAALTVSVMVALSMFIAVVRWFIIHYVK